MLQLTLTHAVLSEADFELVDRLSAVEPHQTQLHQKGKRFKWGRKPSESFDQKRQVKHTPKRETKHSCVERRREALGGRGDEVNE